MFAVLKTGGKQYKVASGDVLRVEKLDAVAGDQIQFNEILDILEKGAEKSGVKAALSGSGIDMSQATLVGKGAPESKKAAAAAARASTPKAAAAPKKAAAPKAAPKAKAADGADDLTRISGVGPVIVKKLHDLGVTSFAQIAAWTPEDIADMDGKLNFKGRIDRDEWLTQAAEFAKG